MPHENVLSDADADVDGPDAGAGPDATPQRPDAAVAIPEDIEEYLDSIDGLTYEETSTSYPGYRLFYIELEQPVDHTAPSRTFRQRMLLHHRDRSAPMVLYTSGYSLFSGDYLSELGDSMGANQITTEQRFFAASTPSSPTPQEWSHVTIEQAATDHHRVVQALAPYYDAAWLSTGHSKGGMTSIYHRRFFPDDVDATVAYVAPISFGAPDDDYLPFFDDVGSSGCRGALRAAQLDALARFDELLPLAQSVAASDGDTFTRSGGQTAAFEGGIAGMEWSFWQYGGWFQCGGIPAPGASVSELFAFVEGVAGIGSSDDDIAIFETYYYQALSELGFPSTPTAHLDGLLDYADVPADYLPAGSDPVYDSTAMNDVADWVATDGSEILFIYGEYDPWTGGAFDPGAATDTYLLVAPQRNHGAMISDLVSSDRTVALDAVERWTGVRPGLSAAFAPTVLRPELPRLPPPLRLRAH